MSPYLLLGFLLAGIMHAFIPNSLYRRFLGDNSFRSVLNATLLDTPLPLCSCNGECNDKSLRTTIIYIEGMRCNHCRTNTEKALASLPEVDHAEVDLASGQAIITGNVDLTLIKQTVESLGFKVKNLQ